MNILPLDDDLIAFLQKHRLQKKWEKSQFLLQTNIGYPGLNVELLEPKERKIYSFRLDKKYRGIFLFTESDTIEVIAFTNHYQ